MNNVTKDLLIIVLIPNLVFYAIAFFFDANRSFINVDYTICGLIYILLRSRILLAIMLGAIIFFDFIAIFKQLFFFVRFSDVLQLLKYSFYSSLEYQLLGLGAIALYIGMYILFGKTSPDKKDGLIVFNIVLMIYLIFNVFIGYKSVIRSYTQAYFDNRNKFFYLQFYADGEPVVHNPEMSALLSTDLVKTHKKILFVISESFGVPVNEHINNDVMSVLNKKLKLKEKGELDYMGFTIGAEMREFCKYQVLNYNFKNNKIDFSNCLIHQINKMGYETVSLHGTSGFMYDRRYWYPQVGFQRSIFLDQGLDLKKIDMCKSFPGACDKDLVKTVVEELKEDKPKFLYWLTLNTHHPYKLKDLTMEPFNCEKYLIDPESSVCRNLSLQNQFMHTLANVVDAYKEDDLKIIIVGDHMPAMPIKYQDSFVKDKVPYYVYEKNVN